MTRGRRRMSLRMVPHSGGNHPKFNRKCPEDCDWLRDRSRTLHKELGRIEWQGEQVYHMPTHNALASRVIVDQLTPLLPMESEEISLQVKWLHAMLDAAIMMDPALNRGGGRRGQDLNHRQSPHGDSASIVSTSGLEHD
jgi:hypothetical protein